MKNFILNSFTISNTELTNDLVEKNFHLNDKFFKDYKIIIKVTKGYIGVGTKSGAVLVYHYLSKKRKSVLYPSNFPF
jgi:hypothetical protein